MPLSGNIVQIKFHNVTAGKKTTTPNNIIRIKWKKEEEEEAFIRIKDRTNIQFADVFVYIECKYVWNWNKKIF